MEPSQEFCPSACTCSVSLRPGSVAEKKAKSGAKQQKKTKQNNNKRKYKKQKQRLQVQQKPWTGVWERAPEKKDSRPQLSTFSSFPPLHSPIFFRLFPFAGGAWAHTNRALKRTWCCNHSYQQDMEESL